MRDRLISSALVVLVSVGLTFAQAPEAQVSKPLPYELFGPGTVLVCRVRVESLSTEQVRQTLRALLPLEQYDKISPNLDGQLQMLDMMRGQLTAAGVNELNIVGVSSDPANPKSMENYLLVSADENLPPEQLQARLGVIQGLAMMVKGQAQVIPGWIVTTPTGVLPAPNNVVPIDDAPFSDGLEALKDYDLALVFVAGSAHQSAMQASHAQSLAKSTEAADREIVSAMEPLVRADWYGLGIRLGAGATLHLAVRTGSPQVAGDLDAAAAKAVERAKQQIRADARRDPDPKKHYDPTPFLDMVDALATRRQGDQLVLHMDTPRLRTFVTGIFAVVESIAQGLADGLFGAMVPGVE